LSQSALFYIYLIRNMKIRMQAIPENPQPPVRIHRPVRLRTGLHSREVVRDPVRLMILADDDALIDALSARAEKRGWESHALSGATTRRMLARLRIDVLLVDPGAIEFDPWGWLGRVATGLPGLALVVISGPSTVGERVSALRLGVDDWLEKPSHPDELIERIAGAVRRRRHAESPLSADALAAGELKIDAAKRTVSVGEASVSLTPRELGVLQALMVNQGLVVERESIYVQVWGYTMVPGDRSVDVHIRKLRAKLRKISPGWTYIHTQFRIGYRFQPEQTIT
jgi:DNA-binding response OmpR family regulator